MFEFGIEQSRELDRLAVDRYGIPSIVLMENAAIGLLGHALEMLRGIESPSVLICCGPGNNGGDGFALARHLHNNAIDIRVICTHPSASYTGDAAINLGIIEKMGLSIEQAHTMISTQMQDAPGLIVDALFGTGLSRSIEGTPARLIHWINSARRQLSTQVLSVDTPSGLDAQTGKPLGESVVIADRTVTFAGLKPGMSRVEALAFLGEVHVAPIGVPIELLRALGKVIEPLHRD